jgi:hypothetical protein
MRDFFVQLVIFLAGAVISIAAPLLNERYQKILAGVLAVLLITVSAFWAGYTWGYQQATTLSSTSSSKTTSPCSSNDLLSCNISLVPVFSPGSSSYVPSFDTGALVATFENNAKHNENNPAVVLVLMSALDVRDFKSLEMSMTSPNDFSFVIEYKIKGPKDSVIVATSPTQNFLTRRDIQVKAINIPIAYNGKINEVAIEFTGKGQASTVTINSMLLKAN